MTQFYAYVHARPDTTTAAGIFYVGKGTAAHMTQRMKDPANRERISLAAKAQWAKLRAVNPTATRLSVPQLQPVMDAAARKDGANS